MRHLKILPLNSGILTILNTMCVVKSGRALEETQFWYIKQTFMLSGTYILQKNKARFNQYEVSSLCPLCGIEHEDLMHLMLTCEKLEEVRQPFITNLQKMITSHHGSHWWTQLGDTDRVQLILDNTKLTEINEPARM